MYYERNTVESVLACSFCDRKFTNIVKIIPDCGKFICGECYDSLEMDIQESDRSYRCRACSAKHVLPANGYANCNQLLGLARSMPEERPMSIQAKSLRNLVKAVEKELETLEAFDPREYIERECERLELEIGEAAEYATRHIDKIEKELFGQIKEYRQRCLDSCSTEKKFRSSAVMKEFSELSMEIRDFNEKWNQFFSRINSYASDKEIDQAAEEGEGYIDQLKLLETEIKAYALNGVTLKHNRNSTFFEDRDQLGKLVEIAIKIDKPRPSKYNS